MSSERQPLLSPSSSSISADSEEQGGCCKKWHTCQLSKAAIALIVFHTVVGASYASFMNIIMWIGYSFGNVSMTVIGVYSLVAIVTLLSPLSGFLADVYCGRYKVIHSGLGLMLGAFLIESFNAVLTLTIGIYIWAHSNIILHSFLVLSAAFGCLLFVIGHAGYQANLVPFGLDQLLDVPSASLALFIHWVIWADSLGVFAIQLFFAGLMCKYKSHYVFYLLCCLVLVLMVCFFLIVTCMKRRCFYFELGHYNPYKMVIKVLNFARKHTYPIQRSAFTYADDEEPSRLDFAKERYGGPFTTEQVEEIKTFLRILIVLLALGLLFVLDIPASFFVSILFGLHAGDHSAISNQACSGRFILLGKGSTNNLVTVIIFPAYITTVFSVLSRRIPRIFSRLTVAVIVYLLGIVSMFSIDFAGHITAEEPSGNDTMCMFIVSRDIAPPVLHLPWPVLLIPGVLLGIGAPLVKATTFEFISAQSPSSMKGLLIGVFFSIKAFFQLVSGVALIPFSYKPLWDSHYMREYPPVTNCGFGYLLFTCVVALIGLVMFSIVARRYKYRERDDKPYDQRFAVDVYSRYLE